MPDQPGPGAEKETEVGRVKRERKILRKELGKEEESSGPGKSSGGKKRGPYKGKKKREVSAEELKALGKTYDDFMTVFRVLGDEKAAPEEKDKATADYFQSAGKLVFMKYAWFLIEYSPEVNLVAAASLWGGYRGKKWLEGRQAAQEAQAQKVLGQLGLGGVAPDQN